MRCAGVHRVEVGRYASAVAPIILAIDARTDLTELLCMTAGEFVRRIAVLGAVRGVPVRFDPTRGKGSHGTLYYGDRFTVVKDRRKQCGPGLLGKMLADLGLNRRDLR
jgi:mRNA interferase HicA